MFHHTGPDLIKATEEIFYDIRQDSRFDNIQNDDVIMSIAETLHKKFKKSSLTIWEIRDKKYYCNRVKIALVLNFLSIARTFYGCSIVSFKKMEYYCVPELKSMISFINTKV